MLSGYYEHMVILKVFIRVIEEQKQRAKFQRIKRVYGIERNQYEELLGSSCPICLREWSDTVRPCVDHDHATGDVRGVVCIWCNRYIIGRHRDPMVVYRLYEYLTAPRRGWIVPKKKRKIKRKKRK